MKRVINHNSATYIRNFVFGVEDSLVSTVGLLSGVAAAGATRGEIILTGTVLIFVEAFSMGVGSFLSEEAADEYERKREIKNALAGAAVMFVSYFIAGYIPLLPYIVIGSEMGFGLSIALSLIALFILGAIGAKVARVSLFYSAMRMMIIGGLAIGVGILVGNLVS